ncbi:glycosyltransferase-like domain-containing protein 1 isoform X5 [Pseudophryne corroboree]|uniref:glycosyltransferase-like domain-containing protein 1 isoform X5 n=1 Tax=Pseudophryne corroboree TaxID=495146 RepID=UPI0030820D42
MLDLVAAQVAQACMSIEDCMLGLVVPHKLLSNTFPIPGPFSLFFLALNKLFSPYRIGTDWQCPKMSRLLVEAFYGGSHKQLMDIFLQDIEGCVLYSLPAKKWHWRARTAALYFMQAVPPSDTYRVLFTSSVLNLAELVALRPDLGKLKKVLYFHENQLVYPVRKNQDRDFQYGYNQILSWFLPEHKRVLLKILPHKSLESLDHSRESEVMSRNDAAEDASGHSEHQIGENVMQQSEKLIDIKTSLTENYSGADHVMSNPSSSTLRCDSQRPLHIVWPHRWEHDKDPETFFKIMMRLKEQELPFHLSVLGETFTDAPEIFSEARIFLGSAVLHWGFLPSKDEYFQVLCEADVVVSTAKHEFFGVAMLEAVHCGCYPLCPKCLVYPEIFPAEYLYSTPEQLLKKLQNFCKRPDIVRRRSFQSATSYLLLCFRKQDQLTERGKNTAKYLISFQLFFVLHCNG